MADDYWPRTKYADAHWDWRSFCGLRKCVWLTSRQDHGM